MTEDRATDDGGPVLTLQDLVTARMRERGWSVPDLVKRSDGRLSRSRWQQMHSGYRQTTFPSPETITLIADVLEVNVTTVLHAMAQTLGLDVRLRGNDFAHLLPAGTDLLSERMRDGLLTITRAAVAEAMAQETRGDTPMNTGGTARGGVSEWPKVNSAIRSNAYEGSLDPRE